MSFFFEKHKSGFKKHYVAHQSRYKSNTFDVNPCRFCLGGEMLKSLKIHYVVHQNRYNSNTFDVNRCRFFWKTQKILKSITFYMEKMKKD